MTHLDDDDTFYAELDALSGDSLVLHSVANAPSLVRVPRPKKATEHTLDPRSFVLPPGVTPVAYMLDCYVFACRFLFRDDRDLLYIANEESSVPTGAAHLFEQCRIDPYEWCVWAQAHTRAQGDGPWSIATLYSSSFVAINIERFTAEVKVRKVLAPTRAETVSYWDFYAEQRRQRNLDPKLGCPWWYVRDYLCRSVSSNVGAKEK